MNFAVLLESAICDSIDSLLMSIGIQSSNVRVRLQSSELHPICIRSASELRTERQGVGFARRLSGLYLGLGPTRSRFMLGQCNARYR